jgi:hypothetical protein
MANISDYRQIINSLRTLDVSMNKFDACLDKGLRDNKMSLTEGIYYLNGSDFSCDNNVTFGTLQTQINNEIDRLTQQDSSITGLITSLNRNITYSNYNSTNTSFTDLKTRYEELKNLRRKLDLKAQELYNNRKNGNDTQALTDSAIYGTLLWTILATSLVYYVFIKM